MKGKLNKQNFIVVFVFVASVLIFVALFYLQRAFMNNFDENDHIAAAFFMHNGKEIYKDFFSHHFPLPYYWTYLFTPFWGNTAARGITVFRLSLLLLYLIVFILSYLRNKNNKTRIALAIWVFLTSLFFTIYHGNLVLSETFSAIFVIAVFWLSIPVCIGWEQQTFTQGILQVLFASLAFWTQPLLAPLFLIPFILTKMKTQKIRLLIFTFIGNLLPLFLFLINGQLTSFIEQAIWFNFIVYPKYFVDDLPQGNSLLQTLFLFIRNELILVTKFLNSTQVFQFVLNLASLLFLLIYARNKKWLVVIVFTILLFVTRTREVKIIPGEPFNFGIYPYLLFSTAVIAILFVRYYVQKKYLALFSALLLIIVSVANIRPILSQSLNNGYNYHVFWSYRQELGEEIQKLTFKDEPILIYPHDVDLYFFAQRMPPDRFVYWFPWINSVEKYRDERLKALGTNKPVVIFKGSMAFKGDQDFYAQYFPKLTEEYMPIEVNSKTIWLRQDLSERRLIN